MKTMLLIDADNVSVGVMEQAVAALLAEHGALHVRRAYCSAESAAKHQAVFKRLGIRPVVNLSTGKNSTDIAMAVDALDLAIAERPKLMAIASSDSDFAPLVLRLREKGCRVIGIGQQGKTGDATQEVYDAFTVLAHRVPAPAKKTAAARPAAARSAPAGAAARPAPAAPAPAAPAAPAPAAARPAPAARAVTEAAPAAGKSTRRKPAAASSALSSAAPVAAPARRPAALTSGTPASAPADPAAAILAALPELAQGQTVELRIAAERLRSAGLLSKRGVSTRLFGAHPQRFELLPAANPQKVRLRG